MPNTDEHAGQPITKVVSRILLPFSLLVLLTLLGAIFGVYWLQARDLDDHALSLRKQVEKSYEHRLQDSASLLEGLIFFIEDDPALQRAWLDQDRSALLAAASPIYDWINSHERVTHFYFHTPEKTNFLRVQNPARFGDYIDRYTMQQAAFTGQLAWGIELGLFGQYVLRVVKPWYIEDRLVGYIELGEEIDHITRSIQETLDVDLAVVIDKNFINREEWASLRQKQGRDADWNRFADRVIIENTRAGRTTAFDALLGHNGGADLSVHRLTADGRAYSAVSLPARDAGDRNLGRLWVFDDISESSEALRLVVMLFVVAGLLLAAFIILTFYLYLRGIRGQLRLAYDKLRSEINEREQVKQQLESYSYTIAHDLRAPLRSITSFGQILEEEATGQLNDDARDALQRVIRAGKHMAQLIDDILQLSRISSKDMDVSNDVDLSWCVKQCLRRLASATPDRVVKSDIAEGVRVTGSEDLLSMALQNLLENAWKFTSKNAVTEIQFGRTSIDGETVFFLRDNGVGFDMAFADKLFDIFQRLHPPGEFEGTGVGLASVKRVIERHKGRIWAESGDGRGATFYFTLKLSPA